MRSGQFDSEKLFSSSVIDLLLFLAVDHLDRMKGESSREIDQRIVAEIPLAELWYGRHHSTRAD